MLEGFLSEREWSVLTPPTSSTPVYKDDCMFSFDTAFDKEGLDICLYCYQSFSRAGLNYTQQHSEFFDHKLFLNYKKTLKPRQERESEQPLKMVKLEIKEQSEDELFDIQTSIYCSETNKSTKFPSPDLPVQIQEVAAAILKSTSSDKKQEIKAWEQEILPCPHAFDIVQKSLPNIDLTQCQTCGLKENLWICLTCGSLGCGRAQFAGVAGNSHALAHNKEFGDHHIAVKLGSLSMDSADCYCYSCNEEVKVPDMVRCLKTFGIDISSFVKTEKNLTELQLEQNIKWDFQMDGEDGAVLEPLFGKGLTGLKNLGNSCYMASALQVLFSIPAYSSAFHIEEGMPVEKLLNPGNPANDLETQLFKLGDGLLSGRYAVPDEFTTETVKYQRGIRPSGFKSLIGQGHPEFCTMQQQDAFEFWIYLIDKVEKERIQGVSKSSPSETFKYVLENKLKCQNCGGVRLSTEISDNLTLPIHDELLSVDEDGQRHYKEVNLDECIDSWFKPEIVDYECPVCKSNQQAVKRQGLKSYPEYLVMSPQRIKLENWVPIKIGVPIKLEDNLSLARIKHEGILPNEVQFPEDPETTTQKKYVFNSDAMNVLQGMGFTEIRAKRALFNTGNFDAEAAMNWLFGHMDDDDIDLPFEPPASSTTDVIAVNVNGEDLDSLVAMGFTEKLATKGLIVSNGNVEQAVDWLFSNPDDNGELPTAEKKAPLETTEELIKRLEEASSASDGDYQLKAVICHKGTSIHSGHYVAFIKKQIEGVSRWVLFNDEKVVAAHGATLKDIETTGYLYIYERSA
ncbi:hypothetical protein CANARDRAFT_24927 [[Candida] arabinofermentans NRRL YB-2248]|uniref:Ubiquitin carboxyl-terminal hydrolase n=1 Tax=[Candida] arabinofermentans NRRL YB-2248 TaxID=983967 RepID=A0A1E4SVM5_9ASCO|nr:hypothetical protein CANARDRAFT_24927 [[Candida] arabinofermentans NRRL YB-2248]